MGLGALMAWVENKDGTWTETSPAAETLAQKAAPYVRLGLETAGGVGGGLLGAPTGPAGAALAGAGGYALGKGLADVYDESVGLKERPGPVERTKAIGQDMQTGMVGELAPVAALKGAALAGKGAAIVGKGFLGRSTGAGTEFVEQALKAGEERGATSPFRSVTEGDKAARNILTSDEIIDNAQDALGRVKETRKASYLDAFEKLPGKDKKLGAKPILQDLKTALDEFGIRLVPDPKTGRPLIDPTSSPWAAGGEAQHKAQRVIDEIFTGVQDDTVLGLDQLKRRLDTLYSGGSDSRAFVTRMRNTVKNHITKNVPQYAEMTKGYAELTNLLDEFEHGLMLRPKTGLGERVTSDMTLRRLQSSLRDNFELRKDLLSELGQRGGQDLLQQVAGNVGKQVLPTGLGGSGMVLTGEAILSLFNPQLIPLFALSSPRVVWETMAAIGQGKALAKMGGKAVGQLAGKMFGRKQAELVKEVQEAAQQRFFEGQKKLKGPK